MADREKVIKALKLCQQGCDFQEECPYLDDCNDLAKPMFIDLARDALELLKEQPQIVRCTDCKWRKWTDIENETCYCKLHECCHSWDWFCADGEKEE